MEESPTRVIHAWSGPRSMSTAMMYSFAQRPDCSVLDEPLYANYLKRFASVHRPYRAQLEQEVETGNQVLDRINTTSSEKLVYVKHMMKQLTDDLDMDLLCTPNSRHVILIRNPLDQIMSWTTKKDVHKGQNDADATNLLELVTLFMTIRRRTGIAPVVVDTDLLKTDPERVLSAMCSQLRIPYFTEQLSWPPGPKPEIDGMWASFWYDSVHKTTGFGGKQDGDKEGSQSGYVAGSYKPLDAEQLALFREALPFYDFLRQQAFSGTGGDAMVRGISHSPAAHPPLPSPSMSMASTEVMDHGRTLSSSSSSSSNGLTDPRNADILIWVGDRLYPREKASVSVFDSSVQGGDAVWEGVRIYDHRMFKLEEHLDRLMDSARALAYENVPSREFIKSAVRRTLIANGMFDHVHLRMTLTRGTKITSSMNPLFNLYGCVLLVVAEWKPVGNAATYDNAVGIKLVTASIRRNSPSCVDSKIHHCNMLNNILPKLEANRCGAADALMLDSDGYVSETNATNVFMVKRGVVYTPSPDYCLPGITRRTVIALVKSMTDLPDVVERRISLAEFHAADEVFTTGTMGELTPVTEIDGRKIYYNDRPHDLKFRPITQKISEAYRALTEEEGERIE